MPSPWRAALLATLLILASGAVTELAAQRGRPVIIRPQRDLTFGSVFAGVPKTVSRLDPANSGLYQVLGRPGAEVSLTFTLPSTLSSGGSTMPIAFGVDDAGFAEEQNQGAAVGFDPQASITVRLSPDGLGYVWLGGTVQPSPPQAAGFYQANVVLTGSYTGN